MTYPLLSRQNHMHPTFAALEYEVVSATDGMQEADFASHPEGKWCVAEILEHLTMAFSGTVKGCKRCLDTGQPIATKSSLIKRAKVLWVIDLGMFPEGVPSPKGVVPKGAVQGKSSLDGILQV